MANYDYIEKWIDSGIIDQSGQVFWHSVVPAETGNEIIYDYSGNGRHAETANAGETPVNPVFQANVLDSRPAIYFDGTDSPLVYTLDNFTLQHIFVLAKFDGAAFTAEQGLLSDIDLTGLLAGKGAAATDFYDFGYDVGGYVYRKNDTVFAENAQAAPMNSWGLMELVFPAGGTVEGIQYGRDRTDGTRRWKGWLIDGMGFSSVRSTQQKAAILLYYKLKYPSLNIPLVFPDPDITGITYQRFDAAPLDYDSVTVSHTYEDEGKSFNETTDTPPQVWEVGWNGLSKAEADVFDLFNKLARRVNTFSFTDKYGDVHENVRILSYSRTHPAHQAWINSVSFTLVKYL